MLKLARTGLLLIAAVMIAGDAAAQPALTTIQDILYRADGTRFNGTMFIRWNSFLAGDTSNIATANLTLPIVNGVLSVRLVPTTTATAGAQYGITYNSGGQVQFTETWAVPPSATRLRVRDVRLSAGTVIGPAPVTTSVQIGDVVGLSDALAARPMQGAGFTLGRTAVINSSWPAGRSMLARSNPSLSISGALPTKTTAASDLRASATASAICRLRAASVCFCAGTSIATPGA